ncbi:MAG: F0F1 ATP synthase subunit B [Actinomycetota bacterium]
MLNLASALLIAQENGAEEPGGIDLVLPAVDELIWGAVSFVIVAWVLTKVALPKIREAIEARESTIQSALERAEGSKAEAQKLLDDYKKQLADARGEANRLIEDARQQAEQVRKDIIAKAEKDAEAVVARAQDEIRVERNRVMQELQGQVAELSITLAEKVVGRSIDAASQKDMVDAYIKEVSGMSTGNGSGG